MTDDWIDTVELPDDAEPGRVLDEAMSAIRDGHGTIEQWGRVLVRVWLRGVYWYAQSLVQCETVLRVLIACRYDDRGKTHAVQLRYTPDGDAVCAVCTKPLGPITEAVFAWGREFAPADDTF